MARVLDLHIHPTLKMHYIPYVPYNFLGWSYTGRFWNPMAFQSSWHNLRNSPEKVMLCAHYVIEQGFMMEGLSAPARAVAWAAAPLFYNKLRTADPWKELMKMMDGLEKAAKYSNPLIPKNEKRFRFVKSYGEIGQLADNEIGLVHAIEGAHALGYGPEKGESLEQFWHKVEKRIDYLKKRGVAMITLSHFWDNPFCPQTDGTEIISTVKNGQVVAKRDDLLAHMKRADWRWGDPGKLAEPFARKLLKEGILIDLAHAQEHARDAVYELCTEYKRPVIVSHNGLKHFFDHEYNLSDEELRKIRKLGGVVGLIISRRLLVDPIKRHKTEDIGIPELVENMRYMADLLGDVEAIGLGSDFDGLTHPFKDLATPDKLDKLVEAMQRDFSDDQIDKILYRNSLRALENGWT